MGDLRGHQGNGHDYVPVPTFDYSSAFNYQSSLRSEFESYLDGDRLASNGDLGPVRQGVVHQVAYYSLTTLSLLFFVFTVPFSYFFCIKKVDPLQRCLTYRLGNRLPLKGPGYVLKLPFIDHISIIDLYENHFNIIEEEKQFLTSDGSIISIRPCSASLNVFNAVLTTLKTSDIDVKECLRLSFDNAIRSKHVEDLENKMHFIVSLFEENTNKFLQRWGYSFKFEEIPRITVIERADPINPIKNKLNKLFDPNTGLPSSPAEALLNLLGPLVPTSSTVPIHTSTPHYTEDKTKACSFTDDELNKSMPVIETFIAQYKAFLSDHLVIQVTIEDECVDARRKHCFQYNQGSIQTLAMSPDQNNLSIHFKSYSNFEQFLSSRDIKYLQYYFS